ncbi:MAG TPA: hypothetical protein VHT96_09270 [Clostridia bacterium]|nr:hypothetical protein [Clostridia bacterium]
MIFTRKRFIIPILVLILAVIFWGTGVIPSGICILVSSSYVNEKYPDRHFNYSSIEYSPIHKKYFVHFKDKDGRDLNLMTSMLGVDYDPLNPPG